MIEIKVCLWKGKVYPCLLQTTVQTASTLRVATKPQLCSFLFIQNGSVLLNFTYEASSPKARKMTIGKRKFASKCNIKLYQTTEVRFNTFVNVRLLVPTMVNSSGNVINRAILTLPCFSHSSPKIQRTLYMPIFLCSSSSISRNWSGQLKS